MTFHRAHLHAPLVSRLYITYEEAMSSFSNWMAAVAQAFSQWIEALGPGRSCIPGAAPHGACTLLGHGAWYHGARP